VYLKKSLPSLQSRIEMRGRDYEKNIPVEYLSNLNRYYDDWMEKYSIGKKLIIPSDHLDFLKNPRDFEYLSEQIFDALGQKDFFLQGIGFNS
jgi:deoxyadenosine/deoxycytidine kinase